ncbi:MAG TPA: peptidoglycan-binding domain-containing protein [Polyangia bacterium]
MAASQNTVPPTPAPATAGLPATTTSGPLPSTQGLSATTANELRPSPSLNADQVTSVQAALAAGGLYRGPIDGNMSGSLRASIREFQQIVGLPQTGNLDDETLARLTRGSLVGGAGSNGTTSTSGNLNATQPFSTTFGGVPATSATGSAATTTPFQLSAPINTSPTTPPSVLIQP